MWSGGHGVSCSSSALQNAYSPGWGNVGFAVSHGSAPPSVLDGRCHPLGRIGAQALAGIAPDVLDERLDAATRRQDDREAVRPVALVEELYRLVIVLDGHALGDQVHGPPLVRSARLARRREHVNLGSRRFSVDRGARSAGPGLASGLRSGPRDTGAVTSRTQTAPCTTRASPATTTSA